MKNLSDNRKFWDSVKPLISNKNDQLIRNDCKRANNFDYFFINVIPNLRINIDQQCICNTSNMSNPISYQEIPKTTL